jgi:hypothetical protein
MMQLDRQSRWQSWMRMLAVGPCVPNGMKFGAALSRGEFGLLAQGPVTEDSDRFLGGNFPTRDALMHGLRLRSRHIALVLQAADDASGIAGFFGCGTGVFRCLTNKPYSIPAGSWPEQLTLLQCDSPPIFGPRPDTLYWVFGLATLRGSE